MDDSDQMVVNHAMSTLLSYGEEIIKDLELLEEECYENPKEADNISKILHQLRFQTIKSRLEAWKLSDNKDLLDALFIVNSYQFPDLVEATFKSQFKQLEKQCWLEMGIGKTSFEKVEALNKVFFDQFNFTFANKIIYTPFEIFTNSVFETREGTDLALGLIYSIVAQSIDLPIYGVTTMNNRAPFVLAYIDENDLLSTLDWGIDDNGVLFYIGVGMKGLIIDPIHLKETYYAKGLPQNKAQFAPSPNTMIIKKYLRDIKLSYENHSYYRYKLDEINQLIEILS